LQLKIINSLKEKPKMTEDIKTAQDRAREKAHSLAGPESTQPKNEIELAKELNVSTNGLATIKDNDLMSMYKENANLGSENLGGGSLPMLKIHVAGKSIGNSLRDGSEPKNGYFFYKETQSEFKDVYCHILTISEGFRADGLEGKTNVFNQILSGVILNDGDYKPFIMYFTGMKLQKMWDFGKDASKYTKNGIPMFALTVKLSTEKIIDGIKQYYVINFDISKDSEGNPELITDKNEFIAMKDNVDKSKQMISKLIALKLAVAKLF
jgi:hypothetical protein